MPGTVTDPVLRDRLTRLCERLARSLEQADPHFRLRGRPVSYRVIAGQTFEITFSDVARIEETELIGVKRLIGEECYYSITPQTAETLTVRFVIPLKEVS
jgi:hypothetical protein